MTEVPTKIRQYDMMSNKRGAVRTFGGYINCFGFLRKTAVSLYAGGNGVAHFGAGDAFCGKVGGENAVLKSELHGVFY